MDGENNGNPVKIDNLGAHPYFWKHPRENLQDVFLIGSCIVDMFFFCWDHTTLDGSEIQLTMELPPRLFHREM